jgi:quinol monooxygenase YgiN
MGTVAGVIEFKAKVGQGAEVARLIAAALPHVEQESETHTVFLVDLFTGAAGRDAHMHGKAAKLIFATVPALLEASPVIHPADLIARKGG